MLPPEGPDDDGGGLGPPLPPEDRLWRHPSELGSGAARPAGAPLVTAPTAPGAAPRRPASPWLIGAVAGLAGAGLTLASLTATGAFDDQVIRQQVVERVAPSPASTLPVSAPPGQTGLPAVATLAAGVGPAVARVEVTRTSTPDTAVGDGTGAGAAGDGTTTAVGSAVVFRDDGYLLTSADLVEHSLAIGVVLGDGQARQGRLVGTDPLTDVAVLQVEAVGLATAVLGSAVDLAVGQPTLIVGSATTPGADPAVTTGIVSALGRTLEADGGGAPPRHGMIQTDAPLDPAATGGPLVDRRGAVVGITTDPPDAATGEGLSFATPIDTARRVADQIILTGAAHHPWLGIEGSDLDARHAGDLQLAGGAQVATVTEDSPAETAGLAPDDVITAVGDVRIASMADLVVELREHDPGDVVLIAYRRGDVAGFCVATLAERH